MYQLKADRGNIRNRLFEFFRKQKSPQSNEWLLPRIQMGDIHRLFTDDLKDAPGYAYERFYTIVNEIIWEFANNGFIYFGTAGSAGDSYPHITITEYGREIFNSEKWLPYDPDGYLKNLKAAVPELDDVTLAYIGEAVSAFNRRQLLSATLTLGVASENLMLLLIENYVASLVMTRKTALQKKIADRWIATQYREFRAEFEKDIRKLPKNLQGDWETYLDAVFHFIRLNRNSAGHPTGKELSGKMVNANLQIFADYSRYIFDLIKHFNSQLEQSAK